MDRQAVAHANVPQQVRTDLESPVDASLLGKANSNTVLKLSSERPPKTTDSRESAAKVRAKYGTGYVHINSYIVLIRPMRRASGPAKTVEAAARK